MFHLSPLRHQSSTSQWRQTITLLPIKSNLYVSMESIHYISVTSIHSLSSYSVCNMTSLIHMLHYISMTSIHFISMTSNHYISMTSITFHLYDIHSLCLYDMNLTIFLAKKRPNAKKARLKKQAANKQTDKRPTERILRRWQIFLPSVCPDLDMKMFINSDANLFVFFYLLFPLVFLGTPFKQVLLHTSPHIVSH